jgi:hypothetical protein
MPITGLSRRTFLHSVAAATALSAAGIAQEPGGKINQIDEVELSQIHGPSEQNEKAPGPFLSMDQRVGFAIVGLGRLSLNQILPAFGHSQYCKPVALEYNHYPRRKLTTAWFLVLDQKPCDDDRHFVNSLRASWRCPIYLGWQHPTGFSFFPESPLD